MECCLTKANKNTIWIDTLLMYVAFIFSCVLIECVFLKNRLVRHGNHTWGYHGYLRAGILHYFIPSWTDGHLQRASSGCFFEWTVLCIDQKHKCPSHHVYATDSSLFILLCIRFLMIPSWEENKVETNREPNRKSQSRFIVEYWTWQNCSQILRWTRCTPALHYVSLISLGTLYCIDGSIISRCVSEYELQT